MPEQRTDDVDKVLADLKAIEDRKQALIAALLKEREAVIKDYDEKLAKLGYAGNGDRPKRNHHKKTAPAGDAKATKKA